MKLPEISDRPILPEDEPFLAELYRDEQTRLQLFAPPLNAGEFQRWLYGSGDRFMLVAGNDRVGVGVLVRTNTRAFFGYAIHPQWRGKRLASSCLRVVESRARRLGITTLTTNVAADNVGSVKALRRQGFREFVLLEERL
jgi:RimJ/RimL family protein N-acetyltransferase